MHAMEEVLPIRRSADFPCCENVKKCRKASIGLLSYLVVVFFFFFVFFLKTHSNLFGIDRCHAPLLPRRLSILPSNWNWVVARLVTPTQHRYHLAYPKACTCVDNVEGACLFYHPTRTFQSCPIIIAAKDVQSKTCVIRLCETTKPATNHRESNDSSLYDFDCRTIICWCHHHVPRLVPIQRVCDRSLPTISKRDVPICPTS